MRYLGAVGRRRRWVIVCGADDTRPVDLDRALWRAALLTADPRRIVLACAPSDDAGLAYVLATWPTLQRAALSPGQGLLGALAAGLQKVLTLDRLAEVVVVPAHVAFLDDCAACVPLLRAAVIDDAPSDRVVHLVLPDGRPTGHLVARADSLLDRVDVARATRHDGDLATLVASTPRSALREVMASADVRTAPRPGPLASLLEAR